MNSYVIIPLLLGVVAVLQPMLNRVILDTKGITLAALINSIVLLILASITLIFFHFQGDRFPEYLRPRMNGNFEWWYVLPGLFGYLLVFFLPLSMRTLGAFATIAVFLLSQLAFSFLYDALTSTKPITLARIGGLVLTAAGAYLSLRPSE